MSRADFKRKSGRASGICSFSSSFIELNVLVLRPSILFFFCTTHCSLSPVFSFPRITIPLLLPGSRCRYRFFIVTTYFFWAKFSLVFMLSARKFDFIFSLLSYFPTDFPRLSLCSRKAYSDHVYGMFSFEALCQCPFSEPFLDIKLYFSTFLDLSFRLDFDLLHLKKYRNLCNWLQFFPSRNGPRLELRATGSRGSHEIILRLQVCEGRLTLVLTMGRSLFLSFSMHQGPSIPRKIAAARAYSLIADRRLCVSETESKHAGIRPHS